MKKQYFLVLDTETANSVNQPLPYDIGYAICDRKGNIYLKRSFVVAEIINEKGLMESAYYNKKIPAYWEDIKTGKRQLRGLYNIRRQIKADMQEYDITKVLTYNAGFDRRAINIGTRYITKSFLRYFFPFGTEFFCIWNMACTSILNRPSYIKFARKNGFISEAGNIKTGAEYAFRYITNNPDFQESHTGLEDVEVEVQIMAYCFRQHKKIDTTINPSCWRKVQQAAKKISA